MADSKAEDKVELADELKEGRSEQEQKELLAQIEKQAEASMKAAEKGETVAPINQKEVKLVSVEPDTDNPALLYTSHLEAGGEVFEVGTSRQVSKEFYDSHLKDWRSDPTPEYPDGLPLFKKAGS